MNDIETDPSHDITTKILAFLGGLSLGLCALVNALIGAVALFSGHLMGAVGDASAKANFDQHLTTSANHAALVAKLVAIGFGVMAALEFGAGEFLRRRVRNIIVPIACGVTIAGEVAFSLWAGRFTALDAILILCAVFAAWTWYRLPTAQGTASSRRGARQEPLHTA